MLPSGPSRFTFFKPRPLRSPAVAALAAALLALFWWLAVSASESKSQTSDELPHLTAGYAYDHFGDFRFQPENGNLPQRVFGLAGLAHEAKFPTDPVLWSHSAVWQLGWDYLYGLDNPTDRIVQTARGLNALFGVALGLLIFGLARARFGDGGALLALGFYILAPNILVHSALATSDICGALFLTLAPWLFWRHLERRDLASGLLAGLATGLALVAKFNGVLIAPIYAVLVIADALLRGEGPAPDRRRRFARNVALALGQVVAGFILIWAFYNFRYGMRGPTALEYASLPWNWQTDLPQAGQFKLTLFGTLMRWHVFPEAWLQGLLFVLANESIRPGFLAGEHSQQGWWQFFPTLFLTKTTLAMLLGLLASLVAGFIAWSKSTLAARRAALISACPIAVTALIVGVFALRSHLNIGDRHILPLYPALFIALGLLATRRVFAVVALVLLAGHAVASFAIRPHYLAGFNSLAGGPAHAYRLAVDSSLDWGQDLPTLRDWLALNHKPGEKFYLGYFGNAWPPHYGVRPDKFLPSASYIVRPPHLPYTLEPGLYAISATNLAEVYSANRGLWTHAMEAKWRAYRSTPPVEANYKEYDELRFNRLCKFLQLREPDANAGYSILLYHLTAADLQAALEGPVSGAYPNRALR